MSPTYIVVVNREEQYSIWLSGRAMPADWREVGKSGTKAECFAFIIKRVRTASFRPAPRSTCRNP